MTVLVGRALQLLGMVLLPAGLLIGMARNDLQTEVRLLFVGGVLFVIGWLLARRSE